MSAPVTGQPADGRASGASTVDAAERDRRIIALLASAHDDTATILVSVALCQHLPAWPAQPPTDPASVVALADHARALLAALRTTPCYCLHGAPEQIAAHALRMWLNIFDAVLTHVLRGAPFEIAERNARILADTRRSRTEPFS
jgi:hypothetical protein